MSSASSSQKVVTNSVIYTVAGLLQKCFSFFLLPLYTAYLTTADYGITSITGSFTATMSFIVTFSLFSAVLRFYVDLKDDPEKLRRFYGTVILFVFCSGFFFAGLFTVLRDSLTKYIFGDIDFYPVIMICLIELTFNCQHTMYQNILRSQQKAIKCAVLSLLYFFVTLGLNILFVVGFKMGATGVLLSALISGVLYTAYFLIDMLRTRAMAFCIDFKLLKEALKYSIPIMPHNLSTSITMLISKVLIQDTTSLAALGVYSVATQFGNMADTVQTYINNAYGPWLYEKLHEKGDGYKATIRSVVNMLCSVTGIFFIALSLFAHDYIILFIDESYVDAWKYVPLIVIVFAVKIPYYFYINILFYYKKASRMIFIATLSSSILNMILSYILIPMLDVYGSILADGIAMFLRVLIVVALSKRFEDVGLKVRDFFVHFFVISGFILVGLSLSYFKYAETFSLLNLAFKVLVLAVYVGGIAFVHRKQLAIYLKIIKNKIRRKQ